MIEQLKTIRAGLETATCYSMLGVDAHSVQIALTALAHLEAMVGAQEPVACRHFTDEQICKAMDGSGFHLYGVPPGTPLYAAPPAQQYEAGDIASASAQGFRDGVASVAQQPPKLEDIEQYRMQMAGICTAAIGYWKEGDPIHPDYDTPALRDVAKLYAKYDALYKAQQPQARPDFADEWTGYLKDGETPFERFLRERKDMQSVLKLYQRVLEENERLKAQQPQAEPDIHEAQGQIEFLDKKNNALSAAIRKVMARLADLLDEDQFKEIEETISSAGVQPQAEAVPLTHVLVPVDEPTDEMVDAACAAVDGLCRVDFVRAYVAAFAHLKAGYRDESYWCGWNAAIKFQQAEAVQACGHPMSLLLRSAESNEPLYCEACDDKSGRHDAERRETELLDANRRLQEKIASSDALKLHAIEELCQLGYTVKDGELIPPDHLHKLVEAAGHPLAAPQQAEAVPSDEVRDAMVVAGARVLNQRSAEAFGVDADDQWFIYSEDIKNDVRAILDAAIAQQKGQP